MFPTIYCSCPRAFPSHCVSDPRLDFATKTLQFEARLYSIQTAYGGKPFQRRPTMKRGLRERRRELNWHAGNRYNGKQVHYQQPKVTRRSTKSQLENDLEKYHYFCTSSECVGKPSLVKAEFPSPLRYQIANDSNDDGDDSEGISSKDGKLDASKPEPWSWSTAYSAFDYWCFYRIELLKYQLEQAVIQRRHGDHIRGCEWNRGKF